MKLLPITIDNRVRVHVGRDDELAHAVAAVFEHKNPQHYKLKKMGRPTWSEPAVLATWELDREGVVSVPRGGLHRVRSVAESLGYDTDEDDQRVEVPAPALAVADWVEARDYQLEAVEAALASEQGIIRSPTGSGKSMMTMLLAARLAQRTAVMVMSGVLMKQWVQAAERALPGVKVGTVVGGKVKMGDFVVMMQQTLARWDDAALAEFGAQFGALVVDEVQTGSARTVQRTIDAFPARYRIGVSADNRRPDRKEFLAADVFGDVVCDVSLARIVDAGAVHDAEVRLVPTAFEADWYVAAKLDDVQPDHSLLLNMIAEDDARTMLACERAARAVQEGRSVLLLTDRVGHCRAAAAMLRALGVGEVGEMTGEDKGADEVRGRLGSGELRAAVGTFKMVGTGADMPAVHEGFVLSPVNSRQPWNQFRGRLSRTAEGKEDAVVWYLADFKVFGVDVAKRMRAWNTRCVVEDGGGMIDVKQWIKRQKERADGRKTTTPDTGRSTATRSSTRS